MAFDIISRRGNEYTTEELYCATSGQTNGNTTIVLFESMPVPTNSCINIQSTILAVRSDFSSTRTGTLLCSLLRGGGNVSHEGGTAITVEGSLAVNFGMDVNTTTQTFSLTANGINGQTINYRAIIKLTIYK